MWSHLPLCPNYIPIPTRYSEIHIARGGTILFVPKGVIGNIHRGFGILQNSSIFPFVVATQWMIQRYYRPLSNLLVKSIHDLFQAQRTGSWEGYTRPTHSRGVKINDLY